MSVLLGREGEEKMKVSWNNNNLGVAETIFEDEDEDEDEDEEELESLSSPLSFPLSSPASPLQSGVDSWTEATGRKPDVKIRVRGVCFYLHKEVLNSKSGYFKRQLTRVSEFTLSPTFKIAANTFKQVADFCYNNNAVITQFNIVALSMAAQLLEMNAHNDQESLLELTESYFREVVLVYKTLTNNVFHSCLALLPEAEQTASLASRCIEALLHDGEGDGAVSCADGLKTVSPEYFRVIAESMQRRYATSHDLLYRVVDLYFLVYNGKMSEDQKTQITSCIDCSILSPALLMHAVQNPRMPLRFIVQAMLIEQLNTHRSLFSVLNTVGTPAHHQHRHSQYDSPAASTLGVILQRDAALGQVTELRAAIDTTCSRIKTLEKEFCGMKKLLLESERDMKRGPSILLDDQRRSSSCRFNGSATNKVERGERGSISSSFLRFGGSGSGNGGKSSDEFCDMRIGNSSCIENNGEKNNCKVIGKKNFGRKLIRGLRNAFRVNSNSKNSNSKLNKDDHNGKSFDDDGGIMIRGVVFGDENHHRLSR
ncbi:BTB/POZ domain-containing protein At3g49900 [Amaranthus tricolor]|uniref:BTB/POZ domain-containing protein At3g49900 n=1 Tax=Amaranthus tricolor TaxID=29722 RepID=UPI00258CB06F|nr:BTB/POZ domain-containing protein At3g49900 [Amaranthus tricolor]